MTTTTMTSEAAAIAKARRRIESLLNGNADRLKKVRREALASIDEAAALKAERVLLLRLLYQHNGDPEQFEIDDVTTEGVGVAS